MKEKMQVKNLQIAFRTNNGTVKAVRDISFDLMEGETLAIVGESGSGKSVSARAIMGILAPNAIVENGEIIYNGMDLLKTTEEEYHKLRGNRLAMVFQDPLSSLNPIVRVGKQLTEAMLLNNKGRRKEARGLFNDTLRRIEEAMVKAKKADGQSEDSARADIKRQINIFDNFTKACVELEKPYSLARQAVESVSGDVDDMLIALQKGNKAALKADLNALIRIAGDVYNPFLISEDDVDYRASYESLKQAANAYLARYAGEDKTIPLVQALGRVKEKLTEALHCIEPNFFCISYLTACCGENIASYADIDVVALNERARKTLDDAFMTSFLSDIAKGLQYAHETSLVQRKQIAQTIKSKLSIFEKDPLDKAECLATAKTLSELVESGIDRVSLQKDNLSYIFRTSLFTAIERYFDGLVKNPLELRRVQRDTVKHDALEARSKFAPAVVPANLIDTLVTRNNMINTLKDVLTHYSDEQQAAAPDYLTLAIEMVDYLKNCASDYAFTLTKAMAKHRAIELMSEVGIPEPRRRYRQYPFEFSGGMRQRIVIAIALSANPDILICDEPTTALDVTIQAQILELITSLKKQRNLSVIFITHDLGVVANMADRVAVMYAGKIVEYGTADDLFYEPAHPYTWALLSSMPDLETSEALSAIPGTPPNMILPPKGDAFAMRNQYAMQIDFEEQPPMFKISDSHYAATWLLHPDAPKPTPPAVMTERIARMKKMEAEKYGQ